jgi:hypothetical protein
MSAKKTAAKKKVAKKTTVKKTAEKKGPGVIATIIATISKANGASADEIMEVLTKTFPDREPDGMRKTAMIQANKNCKSKDRHETRGLVYYGGK